MRETNKKQKYRTSCSPPLDHEQISFRFRLDELYFLFFVFLEGLLLFFCLFCFCLVFLSCCMYKRSNSSKNKDNKQPLIKTTKYSSSSRNLRDIYSRPSGGLEDVLFVLCFRVVYLSFCIYNRQNNTYNNRNIYKTLKEKHQNNRNNTNTLFPSRNLIYIYSRSGRGLDILYVCFCLNVFLM